MQFANWPLLRAALNAGLAVGILDGIAAMVSAWLRTGTTPERVFRYIASGIYGRSAFTGGGEMIVLGVGLHFFFAIFWSVFFFVLYPRIAALRGNKWLVGCLYGLFVWLMMSQVVARFSNTPALSFSWTGAMTGWAIHMALVGLPIVLLARRWYGSPSAMSR
ncbi:hypothetical protein ACWKWU_18975 [Chitinophaga lutea]